MIKDLYESKKMLPGLSMNYEKIDVCEKNCMLYWKEHKDDIKCMHCGRSRYVKVVNEDGVSVTIKVVTKQLCYMPIKPRMKQLFLSKKTTKKIKWHKEGKHDSEDSDIMSLLTNGEAWQALDCFDPEFARDPRGVHLGLSTDGFDPYNTNSSTYSYWLVFIMPYNIHPNKYLKQGFIFLALVIPGPKHSKNKINMFLRPLFEEMKELLQGVDAYHGHLKCRFNLCFTYLWSIHDYLAYDIFAGRCVHDRLNCPICMEDSDSFKLQHDKKVIFIVIEGSFP
jgi:hypothetical protein